MLLGSYVILALAFLQLQVSYLHRNAKIGTGLIALSVIVCLLGTIGFTTEESVEGVPTPNVPNSVFFADEPIQSNPLALFVTANAEVTWDRNDVFLVVADADKKAQCDGLTLIEQMGNNELCTSGDNEFEAVGDDNQAGVSWNVKSGEYFVGIGTMTEVPDDFELNIDYTVDISLSATGYFVGFIFIIIGYGLTRYE